MKIKAKKSLGQNFLTDTQILEVISNYFEIEGRNILEVGPGYGALTKYLIQKKPHSLHLVELDGDMVKMLEGRVQSTELGVENIDFQIFHQDVLKFEPLFKEYFVIANIPYYITSPILRHFLYDIKNKPEKMLIMMQKEVGERILEGRVKSEEGESEGGKISPLDTYPGGGKESVLNLIGEGWGIGKKEIFKPEKINKKKKIRSSILSLMIAKKCFTEKVCIVPKTAFHPAPNVDSIVLAFEMHGKFDDIPDRHFLEFIKICFSEPRKKLQSNLLKGGYTKENVTASFLALGMDEFTRGEELSVGEIIELLDFLTNVVHSFAE